jgi:hypothetical protein
MTPDDVLGSSCDDAGPRPWDRLPRARRTLTAVLLVLAGATVSGSDLLSSRGERAAPETVRESSAPARSPQRAATEPQAVDLPVLGDLAGDASFVTAALRRVRHDHPEADRVLYANTLSGGGRVAFVGRDRDEPDGIRALDVYALRVARGEGVEAGQITLVGRGLIESASRLDPT